MSQPEVRTIARRTLLRTSGSKGTLAPTAQNWRGPAGVSAGPPTHQPTCKPGSVRGRRTTRGDDHSSATPVARRLKQPTRTATRTRVRGFRPGAVPIRSCSRWGLPCRRRCRRRGALLPHRFTLAAVNTLRAAAVCSLWHCPWGLLSHSPPDVIRHRLSVEPGLSSPAAFRHWPERPSGRLTS